MSIHDSQQFRIQASIDLLHETVVGEADLTTDPTVLMAMIEDSISRWTQLAHAKTLR
jgi:hypothetical protein